MRASQKIADADLIIIDEVSMVNEKMGRDLLSFGKKVLVLGDPGQLPPVEGAGFFVNDNPDIMLTEIHRQARENPIIALATMAREGYRLDFGTYGSSKVIEPTARKPDDFLGPQIITGKNDTRCDFNNLVREAKGFRKGEVTPSDRIICLKNNHALGLLNGSMWEAKGGTLSSDGRVGEFVIESEDDGTEKQIVAYTNHFHQIERGDFIHPTAREFDFAYAITGHKAQGSQWDKVTVVNESFVFRDMSSRWLYTAITRAIDSVTVIQWD
jgi:exodeoxyribonuclease-5